MRVSMLLSFPVYQNNPMIRLLLSLPLLLLSSLLLAGGGGGGTSGTATMVLTAAATAASDETKIVSTHLDEVVQELIDWMKAKGGYIHPKVQVRRWNMSDPNSFYGVFLDDNDDENDGWVIGKDELLMTVPASALLKVSDEYMFGDQFYPETLCELAWTLKKEYDLGETKSVYGPYIKYLKLQPKDRLPVMWSNAGKKLLLKVQGDLEMTDFNRDTAEGKHMVDWIDDWFGGLACLIDDEDGDRLEDFFLALAAQRGYDYALVPIYDMLNHHNGNVNTETRPSIFDEDGFGVYALRELQPGEELFYSYHGCPDCHDACGDEEEDIDDDEFDSDDDDENDKEGDIKKVMENDDKKKVKEDDNEKAKEKDNDMENDTDTERCISTLDYWGTPEMLRDFGFVELYPHRFHLEEDDGRESTLYIDKKTATATGAEHDDGVDIYEISCVNGICPSLDYARKHVDRLKDMYETDISPAKDLLPPHEFYTIEAYHKAIYVAFSGFLESYGKDDDKDESDETPSKSEDGAEL
eukprot:scaffold5975_cov99-Cylindrotheca_fusiformis.AAC.7